MASLQRQPAVRRRSAGRPRKAQPFIVQNQKEAAQFQYQAYQSALKSPSTIGGRIQKSTPPQSPLTSRMGTTRSGRRYSPATPPRQDVNYKDRYNHIQNHDTALEHRRAQEAQAQPATRARAEAQQQAHREAPSLPPKPRRLSSHTLRLEKARGIFEEDPRAKPLLRQKSSENILYNGHLNHELSDVHSPERHTFLAHQARIDDPHSPTDNWAAFATDPTIPIRSYTAAIRLSGMAGWHEPRIQPHRRTLRLLERRKTLDALDAQEQRELVEWWVGKYGSNESPLPSPSIVSSRSSKASSAKKKQGGWGDRIWDYVKQRKWNRRKKTEGKQRVYKVYDPQAEYDIAMFGSKESAESWRRDAAEASLRSQFSERSL